VNSSRAIALNPYAEIDTVLTAALKLKGQRDYASALVLFDRALELISEMLKVDNTDETIERREDAEDFAQRTRAQMAKAEGHLVAQHA
jgi:hypothetical protein